MGESALNLATVASSGLNITNKQIEELEKIPFEELLQNENNQKLSNLFKKISLSQNVKYAYVIRKLDADKVKYHVTGMDKGFYEMPAGTPLDWVWLMDVIVNEREQEEAEKDPVYYTDKHRYTSVRDKTAELYDKKESGYFINHDEWGDQISGMVPIYTTEGKYIGLLGVDVYSDSFYSYRSKVIFVLILLLLIPTAILMIIFIYFHLHYRKEMKYIVFQDKVTELYTRAYYENYAKQQLQKLEHTEGSLTVIMIDIDNFKEYNDYYGHIKGDEILKLIGMTIRHEVELFGGCPGRYGGEEFIAFVPNLNLEQGDLLCDSIRRKTEYLNLPHEKRQDMKIVTISLGIYTSTNQDKSIELNNLIEKADKALYIAKHDGKNCFRRAM